jgi:predicted ArsR family transcriptional regulator
MVVAYTRPRGDAARTLLLAHLRTVQVDRSPTMSEMAAALGWSPRRVQHHLTVLVAQGKVVHRPGSRGYAAVGGAAGDAPS